MLQLSSAISLLGLGAATLATFLVGGLWFARLSGKYYAIALGRQDTPARKVATNFILGPLLCCLVTVVAGAILMRALQIDNCSDALLFAVVVCLGYLTATTVNPGIGPNIPRPLFYSLISGSYFFVSSIVISVVLMATR